MAQLFNFGSDARKALIVVAHADDETIFMGGTLLNCKEWEWYLYVLAYRNNQESDKKQLHDALKAYGQFGVKITLSPNIMPIESEQEDQVVDNQKIKGCLQKLKNWTNEEHQKIQPYTIFTHNREGEYGHPQHKKVNQYVNELFGEKEIWEFIAPCATNVVPQPFKEHYTIIQLKQEILDKKRQIYSHYRTEQGNWINDLSKIMLYEFGSGPEIFTRA